MRCGPFLALLLVIAPASRPAVAQEEVARTGKYFDLLVEDGLELDVRTAREIADEIGDGLKAASELLEIGERQVFYDGIPTPLWMGEADRMKFVLRPRVPARRADIEHWTKQLFAGGFRMDVPFPTEGMTPEYRARLCRAAGVTVLGNTLFRTRVPWWCEGVLLLLEARADEEGGTMAGHRARVEAIPPEELAARIGALLDASGEDDLKAPEVRSLVCVLLDLAVKARPELLTHMQRQLQTMAYNLYWYPSEEALRQDFLAIAREQWTATFGPERWAEFLRAWAGAGYPEKGALRRLRPLRELKNEDLPNAFEVVLRGHWGSGWLDVYDRPWRSFEDAAVGYRLPGTTTRCQLRVGFVGEAAPGREKDPKSVDGGAAYVFAEWASGAEGQKKFDKKSWVLTEGAVGQEYSLLQSVSETGVQYRFCRYASR